MQAWPWMLGRTHSLNRQSCSARERVRSCDWSDMVEWGVCSSHIGCAVGMSHDAGGGPPSILVPFVLYVHMCALANVHHTFSHTYYTSNLQPSH